MTLKTFFFKIISKWCCLFFWTKMCIRYYLNHAVGVYLSSSNLGGWLWYPGRCWFSCPSLEDETNWYEMSLSCIYYIYILYVHIIYIYTYALSKGCGFYPTFFVPKKDDSGYPELKSYLEGAPHSELRLGAGPTNGRLFLREKKTTKKQTHQNGVGLCSILKHTSIIDHQSYAFFVFGCVCFQSENGLLLLKISVFSVWFHFWKKLWRVDGFWLKELVGTLVDWFRHPFAWCDLWPVNLRLLVVALAIRKSKSPKNHVASQ